MCGGNEVTATSGSFVMPAGDVEISASFLKVEPLAGIFSISADEVVKFASGNLQYTQSTDTWSFAAKQYEMLGTDNAIGYYNHYDALADRIDLIGWSWWRSSISTCDDDYSDGGVYIVEGDGTVTYYFDFGDWGKVIDDGHTWRTLTKAEWKYVINTRNNASNLKGVARINLNEDGTKYTNGLILLPDTWEDVSGITFKSGFSSDYDAYADFQTFTLPQWEKLESAGAVFLPAAGGRSGVEPPTDQDYGIYWSATDNGSDSAYYMDFSSCYARVANATKLCRGLAVRLVKYNEEKPTYNISLAETENGTVTLSTIAAKGGDEITFRITPNHGYILKSISVMRGEKEVAITDSSFVMPWGDVKISATFVIPTFNSLSGVFSVSEDKTIKFASGNLQYTQSAQTWSFAENEYDMIGTANVTGDALADKIDLFGWSANNTTAPWGISTFTSDYDYSDDFVDWGKNIGDGITWRTLTSNEWTYILETRANASNLNGIARINLNDDGSQYVNGFILLPDDWDCPNGITFKSGFASSSGLQAYADFQIFTLEQWKLLEQAGAVFLPAAGTRKGANVSNARVYSSYWSATYSSKTKAYELFSKETEINVSSFYRSRGLAVRLVQDVE